VKIYRARSFSAAQPSACGREAEALKNAGVTTDGQKFTFIPDTTVAVADENVARQVLRLCDALEDDDDVQNVYSNLEIPDEMLATLPA
jgi:transcriptional/translational regulatory protein YebC/TACO1